ncbi:hypothetical protein AMTR_s00136p00097000, partial [Amborella trichopoda]
CEFLTEAEEVARVEMMRQEEFKSEWHSNGEYCIIGTITSAICRADAWETTESLLGMDCYTAKWSTLSSDMVETILMSTGSADGRHHYEAQENTRSIFTIKKVMTFGEWGNPTMREPKKVA